MFHDVHQKNKKNKIIGHCSSRWHWRNWMSLTDSCFHVTFSVCNGCWLSAWQYIFARNYCGNNTRENCCQFGIASSLIHDDDKDTRAIMQNKFFKEELNEWKCLSFTWNIFLSITWFPDVFVTAMVAMRMPFLSWTCAWSCLNTARSSS